jgi:RNA polymerase sigma-B factor
MPDSDDDRLALREFAETRDPALRDQLAERYRGLALYHARRFTDRGIERDDLEQVALLALVNALDRFDPARGVELSTFASRTIEGELKRHFRDRGWAVRVPRGLRDLSVSVRRVTAELETEFGRSPRPADIADRLGVDVSDVIDALDASAAFRTASLDTPTKSGEEREPISVAEIDAGFDRVDDQMLVKELLERLPERERMILELRFYERLTQAEIGDRIGLSQMHISRLLRRALLSLRASLREEASSES